MTSGAAPQDTWVFDSSTGVFYHAPSNTYAIHDSATGQWTYHTASEFHQASGSNIHHQQSLEVPLTPTTTNLDGRPQIIEEGEIPDDVGWGGLMEPEKLAEIEKAAKKKEKRNGEHGALEGVHYGAGEFREGSTAAEAISSHRSTNTTPPPDTLVSVSGMPPEPPDYTLLRLVVVSTKSPKVSAGQIAVIDTREGGVQIGRDKCEKGAPARVRLREMEVSKTHALIFWGENGDQQVEVEEDGEKSREGWWIVDLGEPLVLSLFGMVNIPLQAQPTGHSFLPRMRAIKLVITIQESELINGCPSRNIHRNLFPSFIFRSSSLALPHFKHIFMLLGHAIHVNLKEAMNCLWTQERLL